MIDVTIENFEQEVIAASMSQPVLVDFWAPWCGPCKAIGPILEKLETAYGGAFKLAKINSDEEQQLAGAFGIRSIPTVVLLKNGQPVDGFMGALPEGKVREFLDKHVQALKAEEEEPLEPEEAMPGAPEDQLERLAVLGTAAAQHLWHGRDTLQVGHFHDHQGLVGEGDDRHMGELGDARARDQRDVEMVERVV